MGIIENKSAQFMLLAGFIIGIGLVITTVMLNNIIFQSNMAGEAGSEPFKYDIVNLMQITKDEMRSAYRNAIALGGNDTQKRSNFTNQTQNFSVLLPRIFAAHGEGVSLNISNWNSSLYANFTDNGIAGGAANWTVMESVKNISVFELRNVSGSNFEVNITNQTTGAFLWSMKLIGANQINITNYSSGPYTQGINYTYIDLLNSSYNLNNSIRTNSSKIIFLKGNFSSGQLNITGNTTYGRNFTRARDYILNATVMLSTSRVRANITIPVSVPW